MNICVTVGCSCMAVNVFVHPWQFDVRVAVQFLDRSVTGSCWPEMPITDNVRA